ncbi:hypothetical protein GCM10023185_05310 [Hymenobacter saemangeumensis]|uniref:Uncharacterized protein n=1 Tax=Hymenobacter saemangeumensis TaxID=1084522 RepID=A0ABP8I0U3_9BACT
MKKTKKKKAARKSVLSGATKSIKKLRKSRLSTTQKVVGGAALLAVGLGLLARRLNGSTAPTADMAAAEESLAALDENGA